MHTNLFGKRNLTCSMSLPPYVNKEVVVPVVEQTESKMNRSKQSPFIEPGVVSQGISSKSKSMKHPRSYIKLRSR